MAVSGCPRNCAEATCKDVGVVCVDSGYEIEVGGAAGLDIRGTEALCQARREDGGDRDHRRAHADLSRAGWYLERIYKWMNRVGLDTIKAQSSTTATSGARSTTASSPRRSFAQIDPWAERVAGKDAHEFAPIADIALRGGVSHDRSTGSTSARSTTSRAAARAWCHGPAAASPSSAPPTTGSSRWRPLPAQAGPLSQGIVHGKSVTCPLHNWVIEPRDRRGAGARQGLRADGAAEASRTGAYSSTSRRSRPAGARKGARWPRATARPAPIAASAAASSRAPRRRRRRVAATPSIRPISAGCAPRARRSARRCRWKAGCSAPIIDGAAELGRGARSRRRAILRDDRRARPRLRGLLCLGPVADRGLLRRQQADEGLHRHGQYRHQFAAVHGVLRRRPPARLRRRHRAGQLRRPGAGRSRGAGRLEPRLVPSGAVPAPAGGAREARDARWCDRSARTATAEAADLHLAIAPGSDVALFNGLLAHLAEHGPDRRRFVASAHGGFDAALAAASAVDLAAAARTTGLAPDSLTRSTICSPRTERSSPSTARASTSPPPAPTRSTRSSIAILRPAASAGPAWGRSRSPASRTRWAGARSAGSPTCSPRIWSSTIPSIAGSCSISGARPHCREAGPQGGRPVPRGRGRPHQGALDHGDQSGRQHAGRRPGARGDLQLSVRRRLRRLPPTDTTALAHVLLPARPGARRTGPSPIPSGASRASGRFSRRPARRCRTGGRCREVASAWASASLRLRSPAEIFGEYARLSAVENDGARDFDIGALADISDADYDALTPFQWPRRAGEAPAETRFFADGRFYHADGKARFVARLPRAGRSDRRALSADPQHRPHPRPVAHDDPHGEDAAADGACRRALRRDPSRRREGDRRRGGGPRRNRERAWSRRVACGRHQRQRRGSLFAPMHWTDQYASLARVDALASSAVDPVSGQPELKFIAVVGEALRRRHGTPSPCRARHCDGRRRLFRNRARDAADGGPNWLASPRPTTGRRSRAKRSRSTTTPRSSPTTTPRRSAPLRRFRRRDLRRRVVRRARAGRGGSLLARRDASVSASPPRIA